MFRAAQSARSLSLSASRSKDLVQQAFLNKIKEYAQKGGDLASSDPAVSFSVFVYIGNYSNMLLLINN